MMRISKCWAAAIMLTFNSLVTVKVTRQWLHLMIFSWFIFAWCDWIWLIVLNCFSHTPHCMHFSKCVCRWRYSIVRDLNSLLHILHVGIRSGVFWKREFIQLQWAGKNSKILHCDLWPLGTYFMCFHMHFQHSGTLEASMAYFALRLFLAIGLWRMENIIVKTIRFCANVIFLCQFGTHFNPIWMGFHVILQPFAVLEFLSTQIAYKQPWIRTRCLHANEFGWKVNELILVRLEQACRMAMCACTIYPCIPCPRILSLRIVLGRKQLPRPFLPLRFRHPLRWCRQPHQRTQSLFGWIPANALSLLPAQFPPVEWFVWRKKFHLFDATKSMTKFMIKWFWLHKPWNHIPSSV